MGKSKIKPSLVMLDILILLVYLNALSDIVPSYVQIFIFVFWIIFNVKNIGVLKKGILFSAINIIFFIYSLLRCTIAGQLNTEYYSSFQVVISRYQMVIYPIIFFYVISLTNQDKRHIFRVSILSITVTVLISLFYIIKVDPQAVRNTQRDLALFGVGDFMLIYTLAISLGPILYFISNYKGSLKNKMFYFVFFALSVVCILLCNLVTSVIVGILSLVVMYIVKKRKIIYLLISQFVLLFFYLVRNYIAKFLYSIASKKLFYWSTNNKIIAIANIIKGDFSNIDTISRRLMLASWSIDSFKKNMLFGINWKHHEYGRIGCHMQWADDLGRYGIFGNTILILNYFYLSISSINKIECRIVKDAMICIWIMFIILGFLNPCISASNLMMIFVVIPSMVGYFEGEETV